ncbi:MAG: gluconate 2-dehydrogenase subunit 3 family protein [Acidimicrobiales bacterium]
MPEQLGGAGGHLRSTLTRRQVLGGISLLPLAALMPGLLETARSLAGPGAGYVFFTSHEAAVIVDASARLVPGPQDDPTEAGHPGAREANVVRYIDTMLAALSLSPPKVHAGGPWSNRHTNGPDYMEQWVPLNAAQRYGWQRRLASLQAQYRAGVKQLDAAASTGDFTLATQLEQDQILASPAVMPFTNVVFEHTIEGMYSNPEYGGNAGRVGWLDIAFPGDVQPVGYTPDEVSRSDGVDILVLTPLITELVALLGKL